MRLLAPLGVCGSCVFAGAWRYRVGSIIGMPPIGAIPVVGAWFVIGAMFGLLLAPDVVLICTALIMLLTYLTIRIPAPRPLRPPEQRFERKVLSAALPCYGAYLIMLALWPLPADFGPLHFTLGYPRYEFERVYTLRIAEHLAALTVLGYLVAETFGRRFPKLGENMRVSLIVSAAVAVILEILLGIQPGNRVSVFRLILGLCGAGFGSLVYSLQLSVVLLLRGARTSK